MSDRQKTLDDLAAQLIAAVGEQRRIAAVLDGIVDEHRAATRVVDVLRGKMEEAACLGRERTAVLARAGDATVVISWRDTEGDAITIVEGDSAYDV